MLSKKVILAAVLPALASGIVSAQSGNAISGTGLPNPNPIVTQNWGELPAGREWGSTAGVDIDPTDGHVWAYERCALAVSAAVSLLIVIQILWTQFSSSIAILEKYLLTSVAVSCKPLMEFMRIMKGMYG